jgi:acyl carrier protein
MKPGLIELVADVLNIAPDQVTMESGPKNLSAWDSLAHVTIAAAVEHTYGVELTMPEILSIRTVRNLQDVLQRHGVAASGGDHAG